MRRAFVLGLTCVVILLLCPVRAQNPTPPPPPDVDIELCPPDCPFCWLYLFCWPAPALPKPEPLHVATPEAWMWSAKGAIKPIVN